MRAQRSYTIRCILISSIFVFPITGALAQGSPTLRSKAIDVDTLVARATDPAGVRVIVTLSGATVADQPIESSSTQIPSSQSSAGPLGDGQVATVEQAQILATHLGTDLAKRQRWSPRLIAKTPYMAMTVTLAELEALAADPNVIGIHEDGQLRPGLQDSAALIGMASAFGAGATGLSTMVAVLDTGAEYGHVFLTPRVTNASCFSTTNATFTTLCPNGMTSQIGGTAGQNCGFAGCAHGTHVAGIAAGSRASGTPLNGVAKAATIFAGQVFSRRNSDNALIAFDSDMLASLNDLLTRVSPGGELASRNVAAVNLSIWDVGFQVAGNCDTVARGMPFKTVIDALKAQRVATVIISGNNAQTTLSAFPGCISTAVTVGATSKTDAIASYSNISTIVDLLAPGGESTTTATQITSSIPTSAFGGMQGTSMAAPHVAGVFAAIRSACPSLTVDQIETALKNTGLSVTDTRAGGTLTRARVRVALALQQLGCGGSLQTVSHDFRGDGRSDIAWRQNTGSVAIWLMNGAQTMQTGGIGTVPSNWSIVGQRDFDGNGKHDLLWRDSSGNTAIWFLDGVTVASSASLGNVPITWLVVGTGDFNGDGKGDLLWRDLSGNTGIWLMNGATALQTASIGNIPTTWSVAGVADLNGDGKSDILWRNTSTGQAAIWFMNGVTVTSSAIIGTIPTNWSIVATGDFNVDDKADIVWRDTSGTVAIWLMNGAAVLQTASLGVIPTDWNIIETGDFNGDGKSDILWRDTTTGTVAIWFLNGLQVSSSSAIGTVGFDWIIQGQNAN
jgi:hypothetical protein